MGTASVLIYITVALLVLLLISQSPQKSGKQKSDKDGKVNFKEFFHGLFDLVRNYDEEDHNATYQSDDLMEAPAKTLFAQLDKDVISIKWGYCEDDDDDEQEDDHGYVAQEMEAIRNEIAQSLMSARGTRNS
ncbi:hypothetical protein ACLB2K_005358 [Fragaria x ananassa]